MPRRSLVGCCKAALWIEQENVLVGRIEQHTRRGLALAQRTLGAPQVQRNQNQHEGTQEQHQHHRPRQQHH
jgi:hypothetical protein